LDLAEIADASAQSAVRLMNHLEAERFLSFLHFLKDLWFKAGRLQKKRPKPLKQTIESRSGGLSP